MSTDAESTAGAESRSRATRNYRRRSEDERIEELESRIKELQAKIEAKKRKDEPLLRDIPKLQKRLRKFAQLALDHGRHDIANATIAFDTSLTRYHDEAYGPKTVEFEEDEGPEGEGS
jgi:molecular chaperone GrpE (heat shock protein)